VGEVIAGAPFATGMESMRNDLRSRLGDAGLSAILAESVGFDGRRRTATETDGMPPTLNQLVFRLIGEFIALNDLLKVTGVSSSGGAGKALVATGAVEVDGAVEMRKTCKIRHGQTVSVGDVTIRVLRDAPAE
jgi:ribosome-associated protein